MFLMLLGRKNPYNFNCKNLNSYFRTFPTAILLKFLTREETQTLVKCSGDTRYLKTSEEDKMLWRILKWFTAQTKFIYCRLLCLILLLLKLSLPPASGVDDRSITTTHQNIAIISLTDLYQSQQVAVIFADKNLQENWLFFFLLASWG